MTLCGYVRYHVMVTVTATNAVLYVNGVSDATATASLGGTYRYTYTYTYTYIYTYTYFPTHLFICSSSLFISD
jgi:hypothetical protein